MAIEKMRLFKIAAEINIGKDAIVQFLESKGFTVENKSTTMLSEEMVEAVYDKFKKELKQFEKQREKVEKLKAGRKPTEIKGKISEVTDIVSKPEVSEKSKKIIETEITEKSDVIEEEIPKKIEEKEKISHKKIKAEEVIETVEPEVEIKKKAVSKIKIAEEEVSKVIEEKPEIKEEQEIVTAKPKLKHKLKIREEVKKEEIEIEPEIAIQEKPAEAPEVKEEIKPEEKEEIKHEEGKGKKKKKRKKVIEFEYDVGEAPKLRGLTIVGKIDLEEESEKVAKKDKKGRADILDEEEDVDFIKSKIHKIKKKLKIKGKDVEPVQDKGLADRKRKKKKSIRETISKEEVDRAIKETMLGMGEATTPGLRSKLRQKKKAEREVKELRKQEELDREANILRLSEFVSTNDLANLMNVSPNEVILKCFELGLKVTINQRLDKDTITLIADDYGYEVEFLDAKTVQSLPDEEDDEEDLIPRTPIVTIMGHVDHGKTSLLDFIRKTNVVAGEAGGITQHIGAYRVELQNGKYITFLDTPGHEAFTAMRARGALVTDIVVLVVAADDSVMPQTIEAISHAHAANVPIIVAINKIDKPDANPDRIKQQLADYNVLVEEWGGKNQSVEISAKRGDNIPLLLEKILLEAELLDSKANPNRPAKATVVESKMERGLGPVSTVIIQKGTLKIGDNFVVGSNYGRVRAMFDERENKVTEATPSMPVRVIGCDGLPEAGDILNVVPTEQEARNIAKQRKQLRREQEFRQVKHVTLDDISNEIKIGGVKELKLVIKCDVAGTVEALSDSLYKLSRDEVRVDIIHRGVGDINESDIMLAYASGAVIIGFQVMMTPGAKKLPETDAIDIRFYNIIYDCINEVKLALEGLLTPEYKEDVLATVEVRKVFKISRIGSIAGCYVTSGKITRNDKVRVLRDGFPVFNGSISSLKRNKDDVREVDTGYECGIMLDGFNSIEIGDIIEAYKVIEVKRTLS